MSAPVDAAVQRAVAASWRLATRTFAVEVDPPFYTALLRLSAEAGLRDTGLDLVDDRLRALPQERALEDLAVEYVRLFVGPRPLVPPYASARSGRALGVGARQALEGFLAAYRLRPALPAGAPIVAVDHVAVVCGLLDRLHSAAAGDPEGALDRAAAHAAIEELHRSALLSWVPELLTDVAAGARCGPYAPVARIVLPLLP
ncbi:molecular chaperone TorD family protein [Micromonospora sp. NPDC050495]|uniref:TorD/DmsD family molecular chaperone n=1 Tax=Micromonospora sp. NPDC050495 TaxID=3154936 RepID=UPI0033CD026A